MKPKKNFEEARFKYLDAFQSIDTEMDWQKVRGRIGFGKKKTMNRIWWAAAAVIILLGVGVLTQPYTLISPDMVIAQAGDDQKEVVLPDGSMVTLNKEAELVYPEKFRRKSREIQLSGEAFFKVESDPGRPFLVNVRQEAVVEVLGTSFNIRSGEEIGSISVHVVEGRVAFSQAGQESSSITLEKDEQASLSGGMIAKEQVRSKNFLSWKTGILFFEQARIGEVVTELENFYGLDIILEHNVPGDLLFTSIIDNQVLESVLEEMTLVLGLGYAFDNDKVIISSSN